jgi:hypothetical protein
LAGSSHGRDSHLCDTQLQEDFRLAFAGNTHVNPERGRRFAVAFDESLPFAEQYKLSSESETTSIKMNSASDIARAS